MRTFFGLLLITATPVYGVEYPFDGDAWEISAAESELVELKDKKALMLKGGFATLKGVDVQNAVVEYDILVGEARGFAGLVFRIQSPGNYEHFYIRPHQSGNPDANQYTPVFKGNSAWQLYHGEGYGSPVDYRHNEWMHVKVVFVDDRAAVYIDSDEPVLIVDELRHGVTSGGIGINASQFSPAWFANMRVSAIPDGYAIPSKVSVAPIDSDDKNRVTDTVLEWEVSEGFANAEEALAAEHHYWSEVVAEPTGLVNLAAAPGVVMDDNAVIARFVVDAPEAGRRQLAFGYSDLVQVQLNGELVYSGDNSYQSRDYRYLGTIGYFDSLSLPLKKGRNEIQFVVTEIFGGWGVQARFEN